MRRGLTVFCARAMVLATLASATAQAYTHFVHYRPELGFQKPVVEKFDLSGLLDQTVYFHVSRTGPKLASNDSYEALVSQVRQALSVWDAIPTSALRVKYGGITDGLPDSAGPAGEILFDELAPGIIGFGGPVTRAEPHDGFIPIVRSRVVLSNDLTLGSRPRPSFSELFFNSLVHELGHALGLQHTFTSSAMSTDITRSTSRAQPLGSDDIAGLSVLYPAARFSEIYGTITGRVLAGDGSPVHLASVVALNSTGTAVSALSAPDGTYRIDGALPGPYQVYVHPLPPATQAGLGPANLVLPTDENGNALAASSAFKTIFYGGTTYPGESPAVQVRVGAVTPGIDFQVAPSGQPILTGVSTYSYPGNSAPGVHPAFVNQASDTGFIVAAGTGLVENVANLSVEVLGGEIKIRSPRVYESYDRFIRMDLDIEPFSRGGPKHLLFRLPDDIYMLPSGVQLTSQPAPVIQWVEASLSAQAADAWSVHGVNFSPLSAVYFDGLPGSIVQSADDEIQVVPPPGPPGHRAIVTVYNPDGQSSAFTLPDGNVIFSYFNGSAASLTISPGYVHVGTDRIVDIQSQGMEFVPGGTVVGFGTSEIVTRYVEVLSPNHLRAVISVLQESPSGSYLVSVTSGLWIALKPDGLRTGSPTAISDALPTVRYNGLVNSATMAPELSPGVLASLFGKNLARDNAAVEVTINGAQARIFAASAGQINLQVPSAVAPGDAELKVRVGDIESDPMLVHIVRLAPGLFGVAHPDDTYVQAENPGRIGETLSLFATGLGNAVPLGNTNAQSGYRILLGGARIVPDSINAVAEMPGLYRIRFKIPQTVTVSNTQVSLWIDGRRSNALPFAIGQ